MENAKQTWIVKTDRKIVKSEGNLKYINKKFMFQIHSSTIQESTQISPVINPNIL
jgi:hypothetical protein